MPKDESDAMTPDTPGLIPKVQQLKEYLQHKPECQRAMRPHWSWCESMLQDCAPCDCPCTCGLDTLLESLLSAVSIEEPKNVGEVEIGMALFVNDNIFAQWNRALRAISAKHIDRIGDNARDERRQ